MGEQSFPTEDVLSTVTGILIGPIEGVYRVAKHAAGEDVFTHQLRRVSREIQPVMLKRYPELAETVKEAEQINSENWRQWRDTWIARHGPTMFVPRLSVAEHESIDPQSELAERIHPDRIITLGDDQ
jgi:hypothetical protein